MNKTRVTHCGSSPAAIRTVKYNGISTYCFRCGETVWEPKEPELRRPSAELVREWPRPEDRGDPWPTEAIAWLASMGFGRYEREQLLGCYWHALYERVIFPLNNGFWTARTVYKGDTRPKWLSGLQGRDRCVQRYPANAGARACVLTEDLLSAAKVGLNTPWVVAIPCLGTVPSPAVLAAAAMYDRVAVWLDSDEPGQRGAARIHARLEAVGVESWLIVTPPDEKDAKYLDGQTIRARLACLG